ncbi:MAG TPA: hypothetical protein PK263_02915 [bacterium]|nr:hypothetical protein [bacterium]
MVWLFLVGLFGVPAHAGVRVSWPKEAGKCESTAPVPAGSGVRVIWPEGAQPVVKTKKSGSAGSPATLRLRPIRGEARRLPKKRAIVRIQPAEKKVGARKPFRRSTSVEVHAKKSKPVVHYRTKVVEKPVVRYRTRTKTVRVPVVKEVFPKGHLDSYVAGGKDGALVVPKILPPGMTIDTFWSIFRKEAGARMGTYAPYEQYRMFLASKEMGAALAQWAKKHPIVTPPPVTDPEHTPLWVWLIRILVVIMAILVIAWVASIIRRR